MLKRNFLWLSVAVLVLGIACISNSYATYPPRPHAGPTPCIDPEQGARYFDFDRIIVYYVDFPTELEEKNPLYPDELKFDTFNKGLTEAIRNNFSLCLKTDKGEEKPIVAIGDRLFPVGYEGGRQFATALKAAWDPRSLTILIKLHYRLGLDENDLGLLTVAIHREGMKGLESIPLIGNRFGVIPLPFNKPERVKEAINGLHKFVRPRGRLHPDKEPNIGVSGNLPKSDETE